MKSTVKATATTVTTVSAPAKDKAVTEVTVQISKAITSSIIPLATADATAQAAMKARDKQVVKVGTLIGSDPALVEVLANFGRSPIQKALKPIFVEAYAKANRDKLYAGQQLSRVLSIAFPGGLNAKPKEVEKARANLTKGIENDAPVLDLIAIANGSKAYQKDGTLAKVVKSGGSGGGNAKTPLETFTFTVGNAVTAAKEAKLDALQLLNIMIDALKASEMIDEEEAEAIAAAATEAL